VDIGKRIRAIRKATALSQEDVARRAGMSLKNVSDLERGQVVDPHYSSLVNLARALNISVEDLISQEEPALAGKGRAPEGEPGRATKREVVDTTDVRDKMILTIDIGEFRAKLRQEGLDEAITNFVAAVAENTVVGEDLYGDVAPRESGQPESTEEHRTLAQPVMVGGPAEEGEEGFAPTLKHNYDSAFDRLVADLRAEGVGDAIIRKIVEPKRSELLEAAREGVSR
jgi:transcriptional regulator with XRE-family HTH domain